jgi:hypothetical protein
MAQITNPQAVRFCNERVRVAADALAKLYYLAKAIRNEWDATGMSALIAYNNGDLVVDGAASDGRPPVTGISVNNLVTRLTEFTADMEANSSAKLNTVLAVAVHTS